MKDRVMEMDGDFSIFDTFCAASLEGTHLFRFSVTILNTNLLWLSRKQRSCAS
jgi:hypothetical protein